VTVKALKQSLLLLFTLFSLNSPLAHSVVIGFEPNSLDAATGESIALNLVVSGLGDFGPASLGGFDISIGFDSSIFAFTSYSLGNLLGDVSLLEAIDVSAGDLGGVVNLAEVSLLSAASLDALQPGEFVLGTLNFNVLNLGSGLASSLSIEPGAVLSDAFGSELAVTGLGTATIEGKATIPLPGTPVLLFAALLAWQVLRIKTKVQP
jgi:hypothetical protein